MATEQPALFEGEGGKLRPGDKVRDPQTGRIGAVTQLVPVHPQVYVQWEPMNGLPGQFSQHLEAELEKVTQ